MSFKFNPLLEVRRGIKAPANKPLFSSDAKGSFIMRSCLSSAAHITYADFLPSTRHVSRWLLSGSERGHAYPYYRAVSGFLAEACKYQKGIICCECRHTPGRHTPVSDFREQDVSSHHLGSCNLRRGPVKWLPWHRIHLKGLWGQYSTQ